MNVIIAAASGFALGAIIGWLAASRRAIAAETRAHETEKRLEEGRALLEDAKARMVDAFKALASEALDKNSDRFLKLAGEKFESKREAIDHLLKPLGDAVKDYRDKAVELKTQVEGLAGAQVQLQAETHKLAEAMRSGTARGKWGQVALEKIVELAGMTPHVDYVTQTGAGGLIPDLIVKMPAGRCIAVDAKFPFDAYQAAQEARSEEERDAANARHAESFKKHFTELASKEYWKKLESPLDLVVMFVPNDSVVAAAAIADPALIEKALEKRVVIATPFTLLALLKAVELGWREEKMAENAQKISEAGKTVQERAEILVGHIIEIGVGLDDAVKTYNNAVGSLERKFLPAVRKLEALGAKGSKEIPELSVIEDVPVLPKSDERKTA